MLYPEDLRPADRDALTDDLLEVCRGTYQLPGGERIQGQAVSYALDALRDKGWRGLGNINNLITLAEGLGFKLVRAQMVRYGTTLATPANVITL